MPLVKSDGHMYEMQGTLSYVRTRAFRDVTESAQAPPIHTYKSEACSLEAHLDMSPNLQEGRIRFNSLLKYFASKTFY